MINKDVVWMLKDFVEAVNKMLPYKNEFEIDYKQIWKIGSKDYFKVFLINKEKIVLNVTRDELPIVSFVVGYCNALNVNAKTVWQKIVLSEAIFDKRV